MKPFKTIFLTFAVIFSFTACEFNNPTDGFNVEGNIANIQDYPSNKVIAFLPGNNFNFKVKISESKLSNNWFSLFLPYELKDKYCDAIATKTHILYDDEFESFLTISNTAFAILNSRIVRLSKAQLSRNIILRNIFVAPDTAYFFCFKV